MLTMLNCLAPLNWYISVISNSDQLQTLQEQASDLETMLKQIDCNTRRHTEKIEQCKRKVEETKKECEKKKKFLKEKLQAAEPLGSRMETDR